jgi:hypothetical protein
VDRTCYQGYRGVMYYKTTQASGEPHVTDTLGTCIVKAGQDWSACTPGIALERTRTDAGERILATDFVVTNRGYAAVAWAEASRPADVVEIDYYVTFSKDRGQTWTEPTAFAGYDSGTGYSVVRDVDLATSTNGFVTALAFLDQDNGSNHYLWDNTNTGEWYLTYVFWDEDLEFVNESVAYANTDLFYRSPTARNLFDLTNGPRDGFMTAYVNLGPSSDPTIKYYTEPYLDGDFNGISLTSTSENPNMLFPSCAWVKSGVRCHYIDGVYETDFYWEDKAPADWIPDQQWLPLRWITGNEFSDTVVSPSFGNAFHRPTVDAFVMRPDGTVEGPVTISEPVTGEGGTELDLCVDEDAQVASGPCYHWKAFEETLGREPVTQERGAIEASTYYVPTLLQKRAWNETEGRYYDSEQRIVISSHDLGFEVDCDPQP